MDAVVVASQQLVEREPKKKLNHLLATGKTKTVHLPKRVPILLLYLTVNVDRNGWVYFREDVYQRDRAVIDGLEKPFAFTTRP